MGGELGHGAQSITGSIAREAISWDPSPDACASRDADVGLSQLNPFISVRRICIRTMWVSQATGIACEAPYRSPPYRE